MNKSGYQVSLTNQPRCETFLCLPLSFSVVIFTGQQHFSNKKYLTISTLVQDDFLLMQKIEKYYQIEINYLQSQITCSYIFMKLPGSVTRVINKQEQINQ